MGGTLSAPALTYLLSGCDPKKSTETAEQAEEGFLNDQQQAIVAETAELIIPTTSTPGAKAAGVPAFIVMMLEECYPQADRDSFKAGLKDMEKRSKDKFDKEFMEATPEQQAEVLKEMAAASVQEATPGAAEGTEDQGRPFFRLMKELTLLGYFTSEIGATQALAYVPVPGRFDGCMPMEEGQKTWAL